ncbi:MAG: type VI secretion system baseplate subunit TssF [Bryobacteraceae bacterium]
MAGPGTISGGSDPAADQCLDPGYASLAGFDTLSSTWMAMTSKPGCSMTFSLPSAPVWPLPARGPDHRLPAECLRPAGFARTPVPNPPPAHAGYRLLQEYFHCPRKFLFFDVNLPADALGGKAVDVLVLLHRPAPAGLGPAPARFRLGCTPVINLFPRTSEPVRVDHRSLEYRLVADHRRETTTEIHSVLSVSASANPKQSTRRIEPFYSLRHRPDEDHGPGVAGEPRAFWHTRRAPRRQDGVSGTEVFLSFHDRDFTPSAPPCDTVYAHLLCTNRALAAELPAGALLEMDQAAPAASIRCLDKPSPAGYPALEGATLWRLVSSLSLNHLSLGGERGLAALKEFCGSIAPATARRATGQIGRAIGSRHAVRRGGVDAWRGFRHGTAIEIVFDAEDSLYVGGSAAMLACRFCGTSSPARSVNSFTGGGVVRRDGRRENWIRWPPRRIAGCGLIQSRSQAQPGSGRYQWQEFGWEPGSG